MAVQLTPLYEKLLKEIESVLEVEDDLIANLANVSSIVSETFRELKEDDLRSFSNWVGFYLVAYKKYSESEKELVLGPFQGGLACTRIIFTRGVCGKAVSTGSTILVDDVNDFPKHIPCDSKTESEIVVPLFNSEGKVYGCFDLDCLKRSAWTIDDKNGLEAIGKVVSKHSNLEKVLTL